MALNLFALFIRVMRIIESSAFMLAWWAVALKLREFALINPLLNEDEDAAAFAIAKEACVNGNTMF